MANTVQITKTLDGDRGIVFHVFIQSDGVTGDLSDVVLIDPTTLVPPTDSSPSLTIEELWYDLSGFNAVLSFDDLVEGTPVWALSQGNHSHVELRTIGGLKDRSSQDGNGNLQITTYGLQSVGDAGVIVIKARKD